MQRKKEEMSKLSDGCVLAFSQHCLYSYASLLPSLRLVVRVILFKIVSSAPYCRFEHNKVREKRLRNQVEEVSKRIDELKEVGNKEKRLEAKLNSEKRRKKQNKADIEAASQDLKQS